MNTLYKPVVRVGLPVVNGKSYCAVNNGYGLLCNFYSYGELQRLLEAVSKLG